jgi:hypothetical protein
MAPHARPDESARVDGWAPHGVGVFRATTSESGSVWCLDDRRQRGGVALDLEFVAVVLRALLRCEFQALAEAVPGAISKRAVTDARKGRSICLDLGAGHVAEHAGWHAMRQARPGAINNFSNSCSMVQWRRPRLPVALDTKRWTRTKPRCLHTPRARGGPTRHVSSQSRSTWVGDLSSYGAVLRRRPIGALERWSASPSRCIASCSRLDATGNRVSSVRSQRLSLLRAAYSTSRVVVRGRMPRWYLALAPHRHVTCRPTRTSYTPPALEHARNGSTGQRAHETRHDTSPHPGTSFLHRPASATTPTRPRCRPTSTRCHRPRSPRPPRPTTHRATSRPQPRAL